MSIWTEPSPSDFDRWEQKVAEGIDPSRAARDLGFRGSSQFKRADPVRHAEVLELWRETQTADDRTTARDTLRTIAESTTVEPKDRVRAAELLGKGSGYLDAKTTLEVSGPAGGPIEIERKPVDTVKMLEVLRERGAVPDR